MLLGLLYAHGVIYLKEHTLFWVVAQLWTCDLCKCFQNLGYYYYFFGCLFLNDISEWELADLLFATGPRRDCHCCKAQIALFIVESEFICFLELFISDGIREVIRKSMLVKKKNANFTYYNLTVCNYIFSLRNKCSKVLKNRCSGVVLLRYAVMAALWVCEGSAQCHIPAEGELEAEQGSPWFLLSQCSFHPFFFSSFNRGSSAHLLLHSWHKRAYAGMEQLWRQTKGCRTWRDVTIHCLQHLLWVSLFHLAALGLGWLQGPIGTGSGNVGCESHLLQHQDTGRSRRPVGAGCSSVALWALLCPKEHFSPCADSYPSPFPSTGVTWPSKWMKEFL